MNKIFKIFSLVLTLMIASLHVEAITVNDHRIAVLVNDKLISSYDIVQRMKMRALLNGINITPENNNQLANAAVEELIKETLKNEKLEEYSIFIDEDEYLQHEKAFYDNIPLSKENLRELFKSNNIKYSEFKNYLIYEMSWQKLISGIYYRLTSASKIEIEEQILKNPEITIDVARNIIIQKQLDLKSSKMIRDLFNEATIEYK
ncbi:SurA N-terminal domain-containing protein [Pelagibacteraceae bacterium]|nr:SurA N-terminal domain-containing protein [Pelagibacteraceae bacterium]